MTSRMVDIDELLRILPDLIRENDTVKGAIITALSGVVATREDIRDLIKEMDKRFEAMDKRFEAMDKRFEAMDKRFEAMDKRFEELIAEMNARFNMVDLELKHLRVAIDSLGNRSGKSLERAILELMRYQLLQNKIDYNKIDRVELVDKDGAIFHKGFRTDVDLVATNGTLTLFEVKYRVDGQDIAHFLKVAELYEHLHGKKPDELVVVSLEILGKTVQAASPLPVTIITGKIIK